MAVDRLEASSQELALLRLLHLVLTGAVELTPGGARGGRPPVRAAPPAERVGLDADAAPDDVREARSAASNAGARARRAR